MSARHRENAELMKVARRAAHRSTATPVTPVMAPAPLSRVHWIAMGFLLLAAAMAWGWQQFVARPVATQAALIEPAGMATPAASVSIGGHDGFHVDGKIIRVRISGPETKDIAGIDMHRETKSGKQKPLPIRNHVIEKRADGQWLVMASSARPRGAVRVNVQLQDGRRASARFIVASLGSAAAKLAPKAPVRSTAGDPALRLSHALTLVIPFEPRISTISASDPKIIRAAELAATADISRVQVKGWAGNSPVNGQRESMAFKRAYNARHALVVAGAPSAKIHIMRPDLSIPDVGANHADEEQGPRVVIKLLSGD